MNDIKNIFQLNPEITFLNHGSFGACPIPLFEDYQKWQRLLEFEPVEFVQKTSPTFLEDSKFELGKFLNCDHDDLVYVTNPSTAFNIIIKGLSLNEGDEVLTTDHEYGAMDRTWNYYCRKKGAKYVKQEIKIPINSKEEFLDQFWNGLTANTKVIFMSHITSPTGLIFPVEEVCQKAKELGLITIIDGAHVPAHIPLDLSTLQADIYTGACHKWMLTPKGCSFLYVKKEYQNDFDPLIISWGYEAEIPGKSKYLDYHEYQGTRDISAFLTVPAALNFLKGHQWNDRSKKCKDLILANYPEACKILNTNPICPVNNEFLGQLCSIEINSNDPMKLKDFIYEKYKIQIPIAKMDQKYFLRISIQAYNDQNDIDKLFDCLKDIKQKTNLIQC